MWLGVEMDVDVASGMDAGTSGVRSMPLKSTLMTRQKQTKAEK